MILIITNNNEFSSNEVIKWLISKTKQFKRVHEEEIFEIKTSAKRIYLESYRTKFYLDEINSVWYRRGGLQFRTEKYSNPAINFR